MITAAATAMSVPLTASPHQFVDDTNQFLFAAIPDVDHAAAPPAVDLHFCAQSPLELVFRVAREDVFFLLFLLRRLGRALGGEHFRLPDVEVLPDDAVR